MPTKPSSLSISAGLRAAAEAASRALKCVPLARLICKKDSNLRFSASRPGGGDPGGEGGMVVLGTAGRVSVWARLRAAV